MKIMISLAILLSMLGTTMYGGVPYGGPADELAPVFSPRAGAPCRIVGSAELRTVKGGLSIPGSSGGGKGGGSGGSSSSKLVNISLTNVPYVNQYIANHPRSEYYCGLASATMVRTKEKYGQLAIGSAFAESNMKQIDNNLLNGTSYGISPTSEWGGRPRIDVMANQGLLYIGNDTWETQYKKTIRVITDLYTARRTDGFMGDTNLVTGVDAAVSSVSYSVDAIWNHINNNKQPAVVVVDSNIMDYMRINSIPPYSRAVPTLHYVVIKGIRDDSLRTRYFAIYDPADRRTYTQKIEYTETQLRGLIQMPSNSPVWVYKHPWHNLGISDPSYRLLVKGN